MKWVGLCLPAFCIIFRVSESSFILLTPQEAENIFTNSVQPISVLQSYKYLPTTCLCMYSSLPSYWCIPFGNAQLCSFVVFCKVDVTISVKSWHFDRWFIVFSSSLHVHRVLAVQITPVPSQLRYFHVCHPELDLEGSTLAGSMCKYGHCVIHARSVPMLLSSL